MNEEINFDNPEFVATPNSFRNIYGNIYISEDQVNILKKYNIDVRIYNNVNDLIYDIEEYLNSSSDTLDDLEWVCENLAEYNYYNNTNK